ncbi:AIG2-like family-domain-containing protein [Fusarium redolens]|uniref:Putative gamma-glutamylcyclotransferase n=1 Tax=Fusarium redolens TaxID=48865 RepID=A0A9P9K5F3_FUSRE|nr:AIG2-like family-domain-containing protein [Fusarium redolens]KAH7248638.1 AIG2-like family-domain-containing protein [Fusarium redolens]
MAESSKPRPLFIYGTLRARPLLAWALTGHATNTKPISAHAHPAIVRGYARYTVQSQDYPAVVKKDGHEVDGYLLILETKSQRKKLDDFEGEIYTSTSVDVVLEDGSVVNSDMYVWAGDEDALSDEPWELDTFVRDRLEDWIDLFEGMEMIGEDED